MIAGAVSHVRHNVPAYVALVIALLAGAGLAKAAIPDANGVIHACYDNAGRTIQVIDTEAGGVCPAGQTALNLEPARATRAGRPSGALSAGRDARARRSQLRARPGEEDPQPEGQEAATQAREEAGRGPRGGG
jgi:hypothetical protein